MPENAAFYCWLGSLTYSPRVRGADEPGYERWRLRGPGRPTGSELVLGLLLALSCQRGEEAEAPARALRVATSYSLNDSGLFDALASELTRGTNRPLEPFFVGTGEALEMGRAGLVDVVWVHSRRREDEFVSQGYGINRRDVMRSEYVIVGPPSDPAGLDGLVSAMEAFERLSRAPSTFVSRGDRSGNHTRELALLKRANVEPEASWYASLGMGMLDTLDHASERGAYALTDLPTYLAHRERLDLKILIRGDARLQNSYGIIAVNPTRVKDADYAGAMALIDFVTSPSGQTLIADFGRAAYSVPLYHPSARTSGME